MLPFRLVSLLLLLLTLPLLAQAKKVSGDFRLNGVQSEKVLAKFALSPYARGSLNLTLSSPDMYENEQFLKLHLFMDTQWSKVRKAQLCQEKIQFTQKTIPVVFDYDREDIRELWVSKSLNIPLNQEKEKRTHYWYVVVDDCSLEQYNQDDRVPTLHYEVSLLNDVGGNIYLPKQWGDGANAEMQEDVKLVQPSHLSADEAGNSSLHTATFILSTLIAVLLSLTIFNQLVETKAVHAALFLVMAAAGCDASSSFCELVHIKAYERDGVGWYFFDALSSHLEAMCDSLVAILLLSIASGWTLPSDVVHPSTSQNKLQKLVQGFRNPMGALVTAGPAGLLALAIIASHAILAQWGRIYDDDFETYHTLEHMPGRVMMVFRILLGLLLVVATVQTRQQCPASLQSFYTKLAIVGTMWFESLPFVTWVCGWAVPYYLRHPVVQGWSAMMQSMSLILLAGLVTSHSKTSAYHKMSRLQGKEDLTDQLASTNSMPSASSPAVKKANPKQWNFGKAKIRLD